MLFVRCASHLVGGEHIVDGKHEHFGLAIENARINCGLTQEALAEMAATLLLSIRLIKKHRTHPCIRRSAVSSFFLLFMLLL